jgi:hypothetical protein
MDDAAALIDSLDKLVLEAPSSWFLRSRVRLNRKEAKILVARIGSALDGQTPAGREEATGDVAQTLLAVAFKNLDFEVNHGGGGGAAYHMATELAAPARASSGST